jgi:4'-phosphopantetheinyl transferase
MEWRCPDGVDATIARGEIEVRFARLDRTEAEISPMRAMLSEDEITRAARFSRDSDRNRFIVGRATLRKLLAAHLECAEESVRFDYNRWGKPALAAGFAPRDIRFNLSHSQGIAIYAITCNREIGVDVETIRPRFVSEQIAEHFFSRQEVSVLRSLPPNQQSEPFSTVGRARRLTPKRAVKDQRLNLRVSKYR